MSNTLGHFQKSIIQDIRTMRSDIGSIRKDVHRSIQVGEGQDSPYWRDRVGLNKIMRFGSLEEKDWKVVYDRNGKKVF